MTEMEQTQEGIAEIPQGRNDRLLGFLTLGLIFLGGASFTWSYFADVTQREPPRQVAAVVRSQEVLPGPDPFDSVSLSAKSAVVVDETTGRVLFELNPDVQLPLASLTKVPLALVVAQVLPPDWIITIPAGTVGPVPQAGERWYVHDLIDFTLAASSNLGADILANSAEEPLRVSFPSAPEGAAAVWRMNDVAKRLGLTHTYFLNDNGLDESPTQAGAYGSARDMAQFFAYAASTSPATFAATTKTSFKIIHAGTAETHVINTDEALPAIPGIVVGKTGYTDLAGGNLAVVFDESGHRIAAVVLGSTQAGRFDDMKKLVAKSAVAIARE